MNDEEVSSWITTALEIHQKIINQGIDGAHDRAKEILHKHNVTISDGQHCVNFSDCVEAISEVEWYNNDKKTARKILYDISYGMFWNDNNAWACHACNQILHHFHIGYDKDSIKIRQGKGFILKLNTRLVEI